jgi:hypothetical protein
MCTCHEVARRVYASGSESRDVVLDKPISGEEASIAVRNNFTSLNPAYRWVSIICWSCAAADRECLSCGESADLGFSNSRPRRVTNDPPPGAHVITEFVVPAAPFAGSVLLIAIATFLVLCIALLDRNR